MHDVEQPTIGSLAIVRMREAGGGTDDDRQHRGQRHARAELVVARERLQHVAAVHELHRVEVVVADPTEIEDLRDVRMLELRGEPGFVEEHADERRVLGALGANPLEHHVALEAFEAVRAREEDLGHPTTCEPREQIVVVRGGSPLGLHPRGHLARGSFARPPESRKDCAGRQ